MIWGNIARLVEYGLSLWEYMNMPLTDINNLVNRIVELQENDKARMEADMESRKNTMKSVPSGPPRR